jgi:hypothetical protein
VGAFQENAVAGAQVQESNEEHCWRARGWRSCFFAKDPPNFIIEMLEILVTGLGLGSTIIALEHRHDSGQLSNWEQMQILITVNVRKSDRT